MNRTGLMAKISIKYVLRQVFGNILADFAVFRVFGGISRDFAEIPEFRGSATARNIRSPRCLTYFRSVFLLTKSKTLKNCHM